MKHGQLAILTLHDGDQFTVRLASDHVPGVPLWYIREGGTKSHLVAAADISSVTPVDTPLRRMVTDALNDLVSA